MKTVYIYHHLGLGDHIIANGMVRTIAKKYNKTFLFCKPHNFKNVSYMYRDLSNLKIIQLNDFEIQSFMTINPDNNYIIAGHAAFWRKINSKGNKQKIDEIFYELAGVPIENKWSEFYIERDIEREKHIFNQLGLSEGEEFAFVHDDETRNIRINKNLPNIKIIKPTNKEFSLFDFMYTIEKAKEIHCINSSFFCLIDCMKIQNEYMYHHEYARTDVDETSTGVMGCDWKIIK